MAQYCLFLKIVTQCSLDTGGEAEEMENCTSEETGKKRRMMEL